VTRARDDVADEVVVQGALPAGVGITVVKNGENATIQAMKKRADNAPQAKVHGNFLEGHNYLMSIIHERETITFDTHTLQEFLANVSGDKRRKYEECLADGLFDGMKFNVKEVFAKSETLIKEHGQPRMIWKSPEKVNLVLGVIALQLNKRMKEELCLENPLNKRLRVLYTCGLTTDELSKLEDALPGEVFENDFGSNDATTSGDVRKYEAMFYYKLGAPQWFVRIVGAFHDVKLWTRYGLAADVSGQRWTGEVTTTTGNSYNAACNSIGSFLAMQQGEATVMLYGDDMKIFVPKIEQYMPAEFAAGMAVNGMRPEVFVPPNRQSAVFLRTRMIDTPLGHRPVPQFGRVLAKLNLRPNYNPQVGDREYMAGKYLSAAYLHRYVPEIRDLLLATADGLSDKPYLDVRNQAMSFRHNPDELRMAIEKSRTVSDPTMDDFCSDVYGVPFSDICKVYDVFCSSALHFAQHNLVSVRGVWKADPTRPPPLPVDSPTLQALLKVDLR
jgi:hypothetical protein